MGRCQPREPWPSPRVSGSVGAKPVEFSKGPVRGSCLRRRRVSDGWRSVRLADRSVATPSPVGGGVARSTVPTVVMATIVATVADRGEVLGSSRSRGSPRLANVRVGWQRQGHRRRADRAVPPVAQHVEHRDHAATALQADRRVVGQFLFAFVSTSSGSDDRSRRKVRRWSRRCDPLCPSGRLHFGTPHSPGTVVPCTPLMPAAHPASGPPRRSTRRPTVQGAMLPACSWRLLCLGGCRAQSGATVRSLSCPSSGRDY